MNTKSSYKKYLKPNQGSISRKETIKVKNIEKLTSIPMAIKIKAPEPLQSKNECKDFDYPIYDILRKDFKKISDNVRKITICPFFVTTCRNRFGIEKPYLQYLLYKYPETSGKLSDLLVFPFKRFKHKINYLKESNKLLSKAINIKIAPIGFLEDSESIFVFYDLSKVDEYTNKPRAEQQWLKLIKHKSALWWVLIDEICNHKKSLNFHIHKSVYMLFYKNPTLIYLMMDSKRIEIPIVAYYGNYYKFLPIIVTLGLKKEHYSSMSDMFGPFYYFTDYIGAFRQGGWTYNYKQRKVYNREIADENGKIIKGGIVRFAIFMSNTKVLLDKYKSKITSGKKKHTDWAKQYQSLYIGRVPKINGSVWEMNPKYVIKDYEQQIPLSMHLINMKSLKSTWDPLYNGYQIE